MFDVETKGAFSGREWRKGTRNDRNGMLPSLLLNLLNPLSTIFRDPYQRITPAASRAVPRLTFQLRHLSAVSEHGHVLFSDIDHTSYARNLTAYSSEEYTVNTRLLPSYRPPSFDAVENARYRSMKFGQSTLLDWDEEEIVGPDVESRETLLVLAKMTSNAYLQPDDDGWYSLGENWTTVGLQHSLKPLTINSSLHVGLRLWLGARCGWLPWPCVHHSGQLHYRFVYQGHHGGIFW